jgi:hypothetical protein
VAATAELMNRYAVLQISCELIGQWFKEGFPTNTELVANQLPKDARLVNARLAWPYYVELLFESEQFKPIQEGASPPFLNPPSYRTKA